MGLGKTVTTLTAIRKLKYDRFAVRRVLVIAPKKVAEGTWTKEKDKWDHTRILRVSPVLRESGEAYPGADTPQTYTSSTGKMFAAGRSLPEQLAF